MGQRHEAVNVHGYMISRSSILRVRGWNENHGIQRDGRKGIRDRLRWWLGCFIPGKRDSVDNVRGGKNVPTRVDFRSELVGVVERAHLPM